MIATAKKVGIDYGVDIYPFYGSDASAAVASDYDYRHALVGCGVAASHGYERTHEKAIKGLFDLLVDFVQR